MNDLGWLVVTLHVLAASAASWHALLYKRDSRAALGWISVCVLFPIAGPLLYCLLGVNRVENRARMEGDKKVRRRFVDFERGAGLMPPEKRDGGVVASGQFGLQQATLAITGQRLSTGNQVQILYNGEGAYPPMLAAIAQAEYSICLTTYIFETNETGRQFIKALGDAAARGVDVRVMIDGMGEKYSFPRAVRLLKRVGVRTCRYNPPRLIPPTFSVNLRNHRKILVVDDSLGFTGGINIGDRHLTDNPEVKEPVADIHFSFKGPFVAQLVAIFNDSWAETTGRTLPKVPADSPAKRDVEGVASCRAIVDGPDENLDRLALVLQAAVTSAQRSVLIMTPYFLPSPGLIGCLLGAALRGVKVQIVLPGENNLPYVHWATRNMLWELLFYHVEVFYQPPPFAHSKLFMVDEDYVLIGSANIDPRSLRLNYELGVEIYDQKLNEQLCNHFRQVIDVSTPVTLQEVDGRSLPARTRDAFCWLFSPYL
ncbi:MAG: cardiolipin synthase [Gammaproteobacteria bacterium]|nr:MAG: cardiolipin synthase [Gammaproteobacteria bacterium]